MLMLVTVVIRVLMKIPHPAADKGGTLVVWRAHLYQKEDLRQLSDTSFYAKVDKDPTSSNQQIVKNTTNDLTVEQELPAML